MGLGGSRVGVTKTTQELTSTPLLCYFTKIRNK